MSEVLKPSSLFPFGSARESAAKKRKRNDPRTYFYQGENDIVDCCVEDDAGENVNTTDGANFSAVTP